MSLNTPQPLYEQVKQHILQHINSGQWQVNQRLPSENELVAQFGFSRMTINRALRELTDEGRLVRLQGVGTFVAEPKAQSALFEVNSIADEIRLRGHVHCCHVLQLECVAAEAEMAAALGLVQGAAVFHSQMVHDEDGRAVQFEDRWVNPAMAPTYLQQDFQHTTPHDYLTATTPFSEGEHIVEALMPPKFIAEALYMPKGEPCLVVQRRTWSQGQIVTFVRLWFPSSRYRLMGKFMAPN
ncbi:MULTISPECIES: histidine utilization repressor [Vitreoscilla]|uniref:Histidine utilization repressor n=1 Tax=Vitreoscilla stercoraria TaxID=61 RepID=A0ABY4E877_VITST|nr:MULTISPECIES: histidine utilization repressor [Vitreoscilla]AUZ04865.2 UTRA domain-containing protein [Vitreoscilla sp. C1]UOO91474.1 histidine utilization repressor [Vitreoscilla stercoraria]